MLCGRHFKRRKYILRACGVDGCRNGWFYFELNGNRYEFGVYSNFNDLLYSVPESKNVFVDIPIGLPNAKEPLRLCDIDARKSLGQRRSSVFPAPIREILNDTDYENANFKSRQLTGRGISKQTFGIIPKIIEVDEVLQSNPEAFTHVREAHPELCFLSLANGRPMKHNKKMQEGFTERLELLTKYWMPAEEAIAKASIWCSNLKVARDDVVDALVLAIIATHQNRQLISIPDQFQFDENGLPMEMVCYSYIE